MPRPKPIVPSQESIHPPAGPDPPDNGFLRELIHEANSFVGHRFFPGDWVDLRLSCSDFKIPPVRLYSTAPLALEINGLGDDVEENDQRTHLGCTVILHPHNHSHAVVSMGGTFQVLGLVQSDRSPFTFALIPSDPHADFIKFNKENGHIFLTVDLREPRNGVGRGVFLAKSLFSAKGAQTTFLQDVWDAYQYSPVYEGVIYEDNVVDRDLHERLSARMDEFANREPVDWRSGTNMSVRDLVDPSLYPYVYDVSRISQQGMLLLQRIRKFNTKAIRGGWLDSCGRKFTTSSYQWLPTSMVITKTGRCKIETYLNNVCRASYPDLYDALSRLLELFIPRFELVYAYLQELRFEHREGIESDSNALEQEYRPDLKRATLRGRKLYMITKITDFLPRSESIEDAFHVEGVSSEHIIMIGMYIVDRDECFEGGDLEFCRQFLDFEESAFFEFLVQDRHWRIDQILGDGIRPLGRLPTIKGRLIVFPNSHIHRFSAMLRKRIQMNSADKNATLMRIVFFFVVDPNEDVISSADVPRQQGTTMNYQQAQRHRFSLITERTHNQDGINVVRKDIYPSEG